MKSWTEWKQLDKGSVESINGDIKGVYVLRVTKNYHSLGSDIIYIGYSGRGNRGLRERLEFLCQGLDVLQTEPDREEHVKENLHSAAPAIFDFKDRGIQFSYIETGDEGVEKCLLIAFKCSMGRLPPCNKRY